MHTCAGAVWSKWARGMPLLLLLWDGAVHGFSGAAGAAAQEVLQVRWLMHYRWGLTTGGEQEVCRGWSLASASLRRSPPACGQSSQHGLATPVRPRPGPAPLPAAGTWPSVLCPGCSGLAQGDLRWELLQCHGPGLRARLFQHMSPWVRHLSPKWCGGFNKHLCSCRLALYQ